MAFSSFVQHYFDYLSRPAVLLSILLVVGPICVELFNIHTSKGISKTPNLQGCIRLRLSRGSNLDDQHEQIHQRDHNPRVKALFTYPVKSCRGVELASSAVGSTGLEYDRMFTFAQFVSIADDSGNTLPTSPGSHEASGHWRFITQRDFPRLALIETELWPQRIPKRGAERYQQDETRFQDKWANWGGSLILRFPLEPEFNLFGLRTKTVSICLPLAPSERHASQKDYRLEPISIWKDNPHAINVTGEIARDDLAKLKHFLGVSNQLGLFRVVSSGQRTITRSLPKDRPGQSFSVGFADAFPLHVLNLASIQAQDRELPARSALKGSLDAKRFRANVYITGPLAYDEDTWKRVKIGYCVERRKLEGHIDSSMRSSTTEDRPTPEPDAEYHVACRTARCKLPNVDQSTGKKDINEPLMTLNRTRKVDKGAYPHPCLGMQMIPLFQDGILRVGDEVHVLERGEHVYEKMFA